LFFALFFVLSKSTFEMFYIYILFSKSANKYYVGHSNNVDRRLFEHNNPIFKTFTSKFIPWELVFAFEIGENRAIAMKAEKIIKNKKSKQYILKLIESEEERNLLAKLVRVPPERD